MLRASMMDQPPAVDLAPDVPSFEAPPIPDQDPIEAPRPAGIRPAKRHYRRRRNPGRRVAKPVITPRLGFFVDAAGMIDFSRTTDESIEKLKKAVLQPEAMRRLGLIDPQGEPAEPRTWTHLTMALIDSVNALAVQAAANAWKLTDDQAAILFLRRKPETHRQVSTLTGELLDQYFPGGFGAYDKEITLLVLLTGFGLESMQLIEAMKPSTPASVHHFPQAAAAAAPAPEL
jgi:hypothetical protein